jgi:hypothetical protein
MSQRLWIVSVLGFAAVLSVTGQTTTVTSCISSYNWVPHLLINCISYHLIMDSLLMLCKKLPVLSQRIWSLPALVRFLYIFFSSEHSMLFYLAAGFTVPALPIGSHYLAPNASQVNPCICSSVTYSMISACAGCQDRNYIDWITWSQDCTEASFTT